MAEILKGAPVAEAITEKTIEDIAFLKGKGITPCLGILRVGEKPDDIAYEKSAMNRAAKLGVAVENILLPEDVTQEDLEAAILRINQNDGIHGVLMLRPLPKHLDSEKSRNMLAPEKDVDGCTDSSLAGVFTNHDIGFPPCTAQAVMEILDYYGIEVSEKKVAIIGRSLVIGRPLGMMLMHRDATVVYCHRKTPSLSKETSDADILISTAGTLGLVDSSFVHSNQVVIDAGMNWDEKKQGMSGDVDFEKVEPLVKSITPVPGGVGTVTTAVLFSNVIKSAKGRRK